LKLVFHSQVDGTCQAVVHAYAGGCDVVSEIGGGALRRATGGEAGDLWVVEDAAAIEEFCVGFDSAKVEDIARANFVGAFIDL
jgi:hypothetical protein